MNIYICICIYTHTYKHITPHDPEPLDKMLKMQRSALHLPLPPGQGSHEHGLHEANRSPKALAKHLNVFYHRMEDSRLYTSQKSVLRIVNPGHRNNIQICLTLQSAYHWIEESNSKIEQTTTYSESSILASPKKRSSCSKTSKVFYHWIEYSRSKSVRNILSSHFESGN